MSSDLISRSELKKSLNHMYDCAYIDSRSKEGIVSDVIDKIDNAPTVSFMISPDYVTELQNRNKELSPICKRVYSPTTPMCYYCGSGETVTTTTVTVNPQEDCWELLLKQLEETERSQGEWIITDIGLARCPFCNCERQYPENYCGYCGADLRSEDNV